MFEEFDLTKEVWREYIVGREVYRIYNPVKLFLKQGSRNHRVLDFDGRMHLIIDPIFVRWLPKENDNPVQF